jgi:hypothetical protein
VDLGQDRHQHLRAYFAPLTLVFFHHSGRIWPRPGLFVYSALKSTDERSKAYHRVCRCPERLHVPGERTQRTCEE